MNKKDFLFGIFYLVLLRQLYTWLIGKGVGIHFNKHHPGKCHVVPGIQCGSEKISVTATGLAFITSHLQKHTNCDRKLMEGKLYLFDFNQPNDGVIELQIKGDFDVNNFDPHGMDIHEDMLQGMVHIYVVNHASKTESVEVFRYHLNKRNEVAYVRTIKDENFICLNDLVVLTQNEFYITNFAKTCQWSVEAVVGLEVTFGFNTGNLVYYRQGKSSIVEYGSVLNGITTDNKGNIFVVSSAAGAVTVYERRDEGKLERVKMIRVRHNPDNIYFDRQTGDLFVGVDKTPFDSMALAFNQTEYSSASAVLISPEEKGNWKKVKITEILHDSGKDFIHGVSSAVHFKNAYLFGTVFHKLAYCIKN